MTDWRRKAKEYLPEFTGVIEDPVETIYTLFFELLPATREAHNHGDDEKLKRYYAFAEWCLRQGKKELWNAAGVAFYEHLGDSDETKRAIINWVKKDVYTDIRGLLDLRMDNQEIERLDDYYYGKGHKLRRNKR